MTRHVVVLGGGTGGTLAANRLRRRVRTDELAITVVDRRAHAAGQGATEPLRDRRRRQRSRLQGRIGDALRGRDLVENIAAAMPTAGKRTPTTAKE